MRCQHSVRVLFTMMYLFIRLKKTETYFHLYLVTMKFKESEMFVNKLIRRKKYSDELRFLEIDFPRFDNTLLYGHHLRGILNTATSLFTQTLKDHINLSIVLSSLLFAQPSMTLQL